MSQCPGTDRECQKTDTINDLLEYCETYQRTLGICEHILEEILKNPKSKKVIAQVRDALNHVLVTKEFTKQFERVYI